MPHHRTLSANCIVVGALLLTCTSHAIAGGSVDLELQRADLTGSRLSDFDTLDGAGLRVEWAPDSWPVRIALGFQRVDQKSPFCLDVGVPCDEVGSTKVEISQISLGVSYRPWADRRVHPILGAGLTRLEADLVVTESDPSTSRTTWLDYHPSGETHRYLEAGLEWTISKHWHVGGGVRRTFGGNDVFDFNTLRYALSFGYGW